jgi:hypothetical protein
VNNTRDSFWRRVLSDHRPKPQELAAAERSLRAQASPTAVATGRRRATLVAMLLSATGALAFAGTRLHWPTSRAAMLELTCVEAMANARTAVDEHARYEAFAVVDAHCLHALRQVRQLCADPEPAIARHAQAILGELQNGAGAIQPTPPPESAWHLTATAADRSRSLADRSAALTELYALLGPGLAVLQTVLCNDPLLQRKISLTRQRLQQELVAGAITRSAPSATTPTGR